jgi:hypothetical protein
MRKEVIIAILLGFVVGLFIAYGIYTANKAVKDTKITQPISTNNESLPSPTPGLSFSLTLNEPEDNIVLNSDTATVSGQTEPKTVVAVMGEEGEELILSDEQGLFSTSLELIGGLNQIKVVAVDTNGNKQEKEINVIYSTADIE